MIIVLTAVVLFYGGFLIQSNFDPIFLIVTLSILFLLGSFATLNIKIDKEYLRLKFGYGIFRKKFNLKEIDSVKSVKHKWYHGWGIRYWLGSNIWIYNVSGFGAIEIKMKNGKTSRIGTDEPKDLEYAIKEVIK
jgi:hypothetical protein